MDKQERFVELLNQHYCAMRPMIERVVYGKALDRKPKHKPFAARILEQIEREHAR